MDRIDSVRPQVARGAQRPYLKIDTQGYELEVLRGALAVLDDAETGEMLQADAIFRPRGAHN